MGVWANFANGFLRKVRRGCWFSLDDKEQAVIRDLEVEKRAGAGWELRQFCRDCSTDVLVSQYQIEVGRKSMEPQMEADWLRAKAVIRQSTPIDTDR